MVLRPRSLVARPVSCGSAGTNLNLEQARSARWLPSRRGRSATRPAHVRPSTEGFAMPMSKNPRPGRSRTPCLDAARPCRAADPDAFLVSAIARLTRSAISRACLLPKASGAGCLEAGGKAAEARTVRTSPPDARRRKAGDRLRMVDGTGTGWSAKTSLKARIRRRTALVGGRAGIVLTFAGFTGTRPTARWASQAHWCKDLNAGRYLTYQCLRRPR